MTTRVRFAPVADRIFAHRFGENRTFQFSLRPKRRRKISSARRRYRPAAFDRRISAFDSRRFEMARFCARRRDRFPIRQRRQTSRRRFEIVGRRQSVSGFYAESRAVRREYQTDHRRPRARQSRREKYARQRISRFAERRNRQTR